MKWTCEYTASGWLITWTGNLPVDGSLYFYAGTSIPTLILAFTAYTDSGSDLITLPDVTTDHPNSVGRLDVYQEVDSVDVLVETGTILPLAPGLSPRNRLLLKKLARDHQVACMQHGTQGELYRQQITGAKCATCTDPATGARMQHSCATCGGSGRVQGWLGPFLVSVMFMKHRQETAEQAGAGILSESSSDTIRLDAIPRPRQSDRLYLPASGSVYILGAPQATVAGVADVPAVIECPARIPDPETPEAAIPTAWNT
jgi:hypothetical protein